MNTYFFSTILDQFFSDGIIPDTRLDYPSKPHNIYISDDDTLHFEVAAQNTKKENVKVTGKNQTISIEVNPDVKEHKVTDRYFVKKLSNSPIKLEYKLHDRFDMKNIKIKLDSGILYVDVPVKKECLDQTYTYSLE